MKLKYNHNGVTETIPLSTRKKQGKRLAIHHNDTNYYAPVVPIDDPKASNLPIGLNGEVFAVQAQEPPEINSVNVAPSSVAVMQGQSATATVSAIGNDAITGLSYGLSGAPTWITISDDLILIHPSDNDLGFAQVEVYAQDTGSDAMSAAIFAAEAKLRPIIESLSVIPPAVTVMQGQSATASVSAVANSAVGGVQYSLGDAPNWMTLNNDVIIMEPTDNDLGAATVDVLAHDINSSASAATQFVATAVLRPKITNFNANPANFSVYTTEKAYVTLSATANAAVESVQYSLTNAPSWMTLNNNVVTIAPADSNVGTVTVQAVARDTGSSVQASTSFVAQAKLQPRINSVSVNPSSLSVYNGDTGTATISVNKNSAVSNVTYTATGLPSWATLSNTLITACPPATLGTAESTVVTIVAGDTNSTAKASTTFTVESAGVQPKIRDVTYKVSTNSGNVPIGGNTTYVTLTAATEGGLLASDVSFSFVGEHPSWMTLSGNKIAMKAPGDFSVKRGTQNFTICASAPNAQPFTKVLSLTLIGMTRSFVLQNPIVTLTGGSGTGSDYTSIYTGTLKNVTIANNYLAGAEAYFNGVVPTDSTITVEKTVATGPRSSVCVYLEYPKKNAGGSLTRVCTISVSANDYYEAKSATVTLKGLKDGLLQSVSVKGS